MTENSAPKQVYEARIRELELRVDAMRDRLDEVLNVLWSLTHAVSFDPKKPYQAWLARLHVDAVSARRFDVLARIFHRRWRREAPSPLESKLMVELGLPVDTVMTQAPPTKYELLSVTSAVSGYAESAIVDMFVARYAEGLEADMYAELGMERGDQ